MATATKGSTSVSYTYNDSGIRTSKRVNGIDHIYTLNGSQIVSESWGGNTLIYLYDETGSPIGMQYRNSTMAESVFVNFFFEKNLFGDIVAVYNELGVKVISYYYDAWGNHTTTWHNSTGNNTYAQYNPFRYRGYYYDTDTQFYYLQSRYYDPQWGRFLNADGYINANGDLLGFNMYAYCSNNPVMYTDPTGKTFVHCMTYKSGGTVPWSEPDRPLRDLLEKILNQSDSVALYDSDRFEDRHPFHGEILRLGYSTPSINFLNGDLGLGSLSVDFAPAGWEWDHLDLSLLDLGYAEVSAQIKDWTLECGAFASIWSPSVAIKIGRVQLEIGAEVGAIGAQVIVGKKGVSLKGAYEIGASLNISW